MVVPLPANVVAMVAAYVQIFPAHAWGPIGEVTATAALPDVRGLELVPDVNGTAGLVVLLNATTTGHVPDGSGWRRPGDRWLNVAAGLGVLTAGLGVIDRAAGYNSGVIRCKIIGRCIGATAASNVPLIQSRLGTRGCMRAYRSFK